MQFCIFEVWHMLESEVVGHDFLRDYDIVGQNIFTVLICLDAVC
jgi:hypothetical protein